MAAARPIVGAPAISSSTSSVTSDVVSLDTVVTWFETAKKFKRSALELWMELQQTSTDCSQDQLRRLLLVVEGEGNTAVESPTALDDGGHKASLLRRSVRHEEVLDNEETAYWKARALRAESDLDELKKKSISTTSSSRLAALAQPELQIVRKLADKLPTLISSVEQSRRDSLIPLLLIVLTHHPVASTRIAMQFHMINLFRRPTIEQRVALVEAIQEYASHVESQRLEHEFVPDLWNLAGQKYPEKRALCLEVCRVVAPNVSSSTRASFLKHILVFGACDASSVVRLATAQCVASVWPFTLADGSWDDVDSSVVGIGTEILVRLTLDEKSSVSVTAREELKNIVMSGGVIGSWKPTSVLSPLLSPSVITAKSIVTAVLASIAQLVNKKTDSTVADDSGLKSQGSSVITSSRSKQLTDKLLTVMQEILTCIASPRCNQAADVRSSVMHCMLPLLLSLLAPSGGVECDQALQEVNNPSATDVVSDHVAFFVELGRIIATLLATCSVSDILSFHDAMRRHIESCSQQRHLDRRKALALLFATLSVTLPFSSGYVHPVAGGDTVVCLLQDLLGAFSSAVIESSRKVTNDSRNQLTVSLTASSSSTKGSSNWVESDVTTLVTTTQLLGNAAFRQSPTLQCADFALTRALWGCITAPAEAVRQTVVVMLEHLARGTTSSDVVTSVLWPPLLALLDDISPAVQAMVVRLSTIVSTHSSLSIKQQEKMLRTVFAFVEARGALSSHVSELLVSWRANLSRISAEVRETFIYTQLGAFSKLFCVHLAGDAAVWMQQPHVIASLQLLLDVLLKVLQCAVVTPTRVRDFLLVPVRELCALILEKNTGSITSTLRAQAHSLQKEYNAVEALLRPQSEPRSFLDKVKDEIKKRV